MVGEDRKRDRAGDWISVEALEPEALEPEALEPEALDRGRLQCSPLQRANQNARWVQRGHEFPLEW